MLELRIEVQLLDRIDDGQGKIGLEFFRSSSKWLYYRHLFGRKATRQQAAN